MPRAKKSGSSTQDHNPRLSQDLKMSPEQIAAKIAQAIVAIDESKTILKELENKTPEIKQFQFNKLNQTLTKYLLHPIFTSETKNIRGDVNFLAFIHEILLTQTEVNHLKNEIQKLENETLQKTHPNKKSQTTSEKKLTPESENILSQATALLTKINDEFNQFSFNEKSRRPLREGQTFAEQTAIIRNTQKEAEQKLPLLMKEFKELKDKYHSIHQESVITHKMQEIQKSVDALQSVIKREKHETTVTSAKEAEALKTEFDALIAKITHFTTRILDLKHSQNPSAPELEKIPDHPIEAFTAEKEAFDKKYEKAAADFNFLNDIKNRKKLFDEKIANLRESLGIVLELKNDHKNSELMEKQFSNLKTKMDKTLEASRIRSAPDTSSYEDLKTLYTNHKSYHDKNKILLEEADMEFSDIQNQVTPSIAKVNPSVAFSKIEFEFNRRKTELNELQKKLEDELKTSRDNQINRHLKITEKLASEVTSFENGIAGLRGAWQSLDLYAANKQTLTLLSKQKDDISNFVKDFHQKYSTMANDFHLEESQKKRLLEAIQAQEARLTTPEATLKASEEKRIKFRNDTIDAYNKEFKSRYDEIDKAIKEKNYTLIKTYFGNPSYFDNFKNRQIQLEETFNSEKSDLPATKWWSTVNERLFNTKLAEAKRVYNEYKKQQEALSEINEVINDEKWRLTTWFGLPTGIEMLRKIINKPESLKNPEETLKEYQKIAQLRLHARLGFFGRLTQNFAAERLYHYILNLTPDRLSNWNKDCQKELQNKRPAKPITSTLSPPRLG